MNKVTILINQKTRNVSHNEASKLEEGITFSSEMKPFLISVTGQLCTYGIKRFTVNCNLNKCKERKAKIK